MENMFTTSGISCILSTDRQRSEREILQEQLREWRNTDKHIHMVISRIEKRLAEIERATVECEKAEAAA